MIRKAETDFLQSRLEDFAKTPGYGAQMYIDARLTLQNENMRYEFYTFDNGAVLALDVVRAYLLGQPDDDEELALFLQHRGIDYFTSNGYLPLGWWVTECTAMHRPPEAAPPPGPPEGFDLLPSADDLLGLLSEGAPWNQAARDRVYFNICMRRNHAGADIVGIRENGRLVATAGIYSVTPVEGFIANVKTAEAARGKGYASKLVEWLCLQHADIQKGLMCKLALCPFYEKLGFIKTEGGRVVVAQPPGSNGFL